MAADAYALALAVRTLHVVAGTILLGGPALVLAVALNRHADARTRLAAASAHEWLAWPALALIVLSGVGNLGALAPGVPPMESAWGGAFLVKLALVLALLVVSAARTLAVARARAGAPVTPRFMASAYALTVALSTGILVAAVRLAHA